MKENQNVPSLLIKNDNYIKFKVLPEGSECQKRNPFSDHHWLDEVPKVSVDGGKEKKKQPYTYNVFKFFLFLIFTLKAIPFQENIHDGGIFVCMVSIFCIVLPKFVIAMTIIL